MNNSFKLLFCLLISTSFWANAQKGLYTYVGIKKSFATNTANSMSDGESRYSTGTSINPSLELSYRANLYMNKLFLQLGSKLYSNSLFLKYKYKGQSLNYEMKAGTSYTVLEFPIGIGVQLPQQFQLYFNYAHSLNYNNGWSTSASALSSGTSFFTNNIDMANYGNYFSRIASASVVKDYNKWSAKLTGAYAFQYFGIALRHIVSSSELNINEAKLSNTAPLYFNLSIGYKILSHTQNENKPARHKGGKYGCPSVF